MRQTSPSARRRPSGAAALSGAPHGRFDERLDCEAAGEEAGPQPKKRSPLASERDEFLRAAWRVMVSGELCAKRLVFVDEMGSNTSLHELYAYSPKGERAYCSVARNLKARTRHCFRA